MVHLAANYLGQFWVAFMGMAFVPIYIKLIGVESYGLVGLFVLMQSVFTLLDLGMGPAVGREASKFKGGAISLKTVTDTLRSIEVVIIIVALVAVVSIIFSSDFLAAHWIGESNLPRQKISDSLKFVGCLIGLRLVEGVYRSTLLGLNLHVQFNVATSLLATGKGLGAVGALHWISADIETFFAWQVALSVLSILVYACLVYRELDISVFSGRYSGALIKKIWHFAWGMFLISLLSMLITQLDKIIMAKTLELKDFAHYMLAATVAGALFMLAVPITQTYYAKFCIALNRSEKELAELFHLSSQIMVAIVGSIATVIAINARVILDLWTKDPELSINVAPLLTGLVLGNFINCLSLVPYQMQLANGWTGLAVKMNAFGLVLIFVSISVVTPTYGAIAAAYIWVLINTVFLAVGTNLMFQRLLSSERWRWYFEDVARPIGVVLVVALGSRELLSATNDVAVAVLLLVLSVAIACAACVLVSPLLRVRLMGYVLRSSGWTN